MLALSRSKILAAAVAGLALLTLAGVLAGGARSDASAAAMSTPAGGEAPPSWEQASDALLVDVAGAVRRPGVYELPAGARVREAIIAAGGAAPGAQLQSINRAAQLVDGQQVLVPDATAPAGSGEGAAGGSPPGPISLSSATAADLEEIPGIGPVTAAAIVADRDENGAFADVADLQRVPGIGPATVERMGDMVNPKHV